MTGNVWEWTSDWYQEHTASTCCAPENPLGGPADGSIEPGRPFSVPKRVVGGGSFLCADNYWLRYRPAARRPQMIDTSMGHAGYQPEGTVTP